MFSKMTGINLEDGDDKFPLTILVLAYDRGLNLVIYYLAMLG